MHQKLRSGRQSTGTSQLATAGWLTDMGSGETEQSMLRVRGIVISVPLVCTTVCTLSQLTRQLSPK